MAKKRLFVKLIIFDLDGTLVDSKDDIIDAVNATLRHLGLRTRPRKLVSSFIGWGSNSLIEGVLGTENRELAKKAIDHYWTYYRRHGLDRTRLFPGTVAVLERFRGVKMAVVSNKAKSFVIQQLRALGIRKYFSDIIGGDDIKCAKPSPCGVNMLLRKYGVRRDNAVIVGDMALDIETGRNARIHTVGVTFGIGDVKELKRARPDFVISRLSQLKEILE